ncbi:MAG: DUF3048 domain-containing protein [Patescibacteria group bacterium]
MKQKLLFILAGISLFVFVTGLSYLGFSRSNLSPANPSQVTTDKKSDNKKSKIDPSLPRIEACPLNGAMFTKTEKDVWSTRRPLAAMIENHLDSRPLSGLSSADIVYEAVAEGGITRFMGVFYCGAASENVTLAPVRSARIYFTKLVSEYDALYNHVGGAGNCDDPTVDVRAKALCFIRTNKIKDLDQFGLDFKACHRVTNRLEKEVAYEHTMACYTDELYRVAIKRGWTNVDAKGVSWDKNFTAWKFKDDDSNHGSTSSIKFAFWNNKPDYDVAWQYDSAGNVYTRSTGVQKDIDLNTGEQTSAKNIVVQFVKQTGPVDEHFHMLYEVTGIGKGLLFQDGKAFPITWSKATPAIRTKFVLADSKKEVQFNRGPIWIELVPTGNPIEYSQ